MTYSFPTGRASDRAGDLWRHIQDEFSLGLDSRGACADGRFGVLAAGVFVPNSLLLAPAAVATLAGMGHRQRLRREHPVRKEGLHEFGIGYSRCSPGRSIGLGVILEERLVGIEWVGKGS